MSKSLPTGIYDSPYSYRAIVNTAVGRKEKRFSKDTPIKEIQRWRNETRGKFAAIARREPARPKHRRTLGFDVGRYLSTLTGRTQSDADALLAHWTIGFGDVHRSRITAVQVKAQVRAWEEAGVSASSINHRVRALRALFRTLDGEDEPNPTDSVRKLREPEPVERAVPLALVLTIIDAMPDHGRPEKDKPRPEASLTKARARVMCWTGLPPSILGQIRPEDFDKDAAALKVKPRRKGKGTPAVTLPLLPEAVGALDHFFAIKAQGAFSTSAFHSSWARAQAIVRETQPDLPHIRPYDVRHSFLTEAYQRSKDLLAVKQLALHSRSTTTERYVQRAVAPAAAAAIQGWHGMPILADRVGRTRKKREDTKKR